MIAGCSGGRTVGTSAPPPLPAPQASALANVAAAMLSITVPPMPALDSRGRRPTSTRTPSTVSPATTQVALSAVYAAGTPSAQTVYQTTFNLHTYPPCMNPNPGVYNCTINVPVGTYTLYMNLLDSRGDVLSTNNASPYPAPTTIYPNGSTLGNMYNGSSV
ncbi:MAG: hypothetical protein JO036_11405, partial [Candidatus Eremiobacteraeota bacterium]|nr:hypothetical protein [Candidatus Eremiobacteraeota bacterium]